MSSILTDWIVETQPHRCGTVNVYCLCLLSALPLPSCDSACTPAHTTLLIFLVLYDRYQSIFILHMTKLMRDMADSVGWFGGMFHSAARGFLMLLDYARLVHVLCYSASSQPAFAQPQASSACRSCAGNRRFRAIACGRPFVETQNSNYDSVPPLCEAPPSVH